MRGVPRRGPDAITNATISCPPSLPVRRHPPSLPSHSPGLPANQKPSKSVVPKTNKTLDELKAEGAIIEEDAPSGPSSQLFDEVDGGTEYHSEVEEIEETEQSSDGITVDENGTEWYEDEVGVWWYREQGWQDWAEWQD